MIYAVALLLAGQSAPPPLTGIFMPYGEMAPFSGEAPDPPVGPTPRRSWQCDLRRPDGSRISLTGTSEAGAGAALGHAEHVAVQIRSGSGHNFAGTYNAVVSRNAFYNFRVHNYRFLIDLEGPGGEGAANVFDYENDQPLPFAIGFCHASTSDGAHS